MSVKSPVVTLSILVTGILAAYTGYSHVQKSSSTDGPAYTQIAHTKKLLPPVTVKMSVIDEALVPGKIYTLQATLLSSREFTGAQWEWTAPTGVTLLDSSTGMIDMKGEEKLISMRFVQNDAKNRRIRLSLKEAGTDMLIGRSTYNTTRQRAIAAENQKLQERQEEYLQENPELLQPKKKAHRH